VSLGVTVFCILALPHVRLGITTKEVKRVRVKYLKLESGLVLVLGLSVNVLELGVRVRVKIRGGQDLETLMVRNAWVRKG